MRNVLRTRSGQWAKVAAVPLLAILIGVGVAIASSPASVTRGPRSATTLPEPSPTQSPQTTPVPTVTTAGLLGSNPRLQAAGSSVTIQGASVAAASNDGGKTWSILTLPSRASGIAVDGANPLHGIAGGAGIQATADGGKSWRSTQTPPLGKGPYQPLLISPYDGGVWFLLHQGKLLRTRDGSLTWEDLSTLPILSSPAMAPGPVKGEFFLGNGNRVFQLIDNGQTVTEEPALPTGVNVVELSAAGGSDATLFARLADGGLYLLKGRVWAKVTGVASGPIGAGAGGVLLVGDGGARLSQGAVNYSSDLGTSWRQAQGLPYDQSVEAVAGQPGSATFYAYCYGGDIFVSLDGGSNWNALSDALRTRAG
jgi:hypothetical protein